MRCDSSSGAGSNHLPNHVVRRTQDVVERFGQEMLEIGEVIHGQRGHVLMHAMQGPDHCSKATSDVVEQA
jgi:hypothetical protein